MTFPIQLLMFLIECHCPTPREKPANARIRVCDNGTDSKQEYDGDSGGPEEKKGPLFFSVLESSWKKRHFCNRQVIKEHKCRKRGYKHSPWESGGQRSSSRFGGITRHFKEELAPTKPLRLGFKISII